MKKHKKRIVFIVIVSLISLLLCGCGESDSARLDRLTREAEQKRREAQEAKDNYNSLKNFMDKYGK